MSERDPFQVLSQVAELPHEPDVKFGADLLDVLIDRLSGSAEVGSAVLQIETQNDEPISEEIMVIDIQERELESASRISRWASVAAAAAVIAALVVYFSVDDGDDGPVITDEPQTTTTAAPATTTTTEPSTTTGAAAPLIVEPRIPLDLGVVQSVLEAAGGVEALSLATIEESNPWHVVTFDPLNNNRLLFADLYSEPLLSDFVPVGQELWTIENETPSLRELPWLAERDPVAGGRFQRDGGILMSPDDGESIPFVPVLDNSGELVERINTKSTANTVKSQFSALLGASEGGRIATLGHEYYQCPFSEAKVASPDGVVVLERKPNAYSRIAIVEPGVVVAFPYFANSASCEPNMATEARAFDLVSGEPLSSHPLDGLAIARAAMSGDGSRAITLSPTGEVAVIATEDGAPVAVLEDGADAGHVVVPLALNRDGSIAAIAEETGRITVWHVDSGELLLEARSDVRVGPSDGATATPSGIEVTAAISYDASRVALLDADLGAWTILSLDPNEWLGLACSSGFSLEAEAAEAAGLDPSATC